MAFWVVAAEDNRSSVSSRHRALCPYYLSGLTWPSHRGLLKENVLPIRTATFAHGETEMLRVRAKASRKRSSWLTTSSAPS